VTTQDPELDEFDIIGRYFGRQGLRRADVIVGIGDDAAILRVPEGQDLVVAIDTLISGVHFPEDTPPACIGYKALAVNLSDLAAMGAVPAWATLAMSLPHVDRAWLAAFCRGFFALADEYDVQLIGGDTTRGPLSMSVQVHGLLPRGHGLRRSGARVGDRVFVTGRLGEAAMALQWLQGRRQLAVADDVLRACLERLNRPRPRVEFGLRLRELATSAIDVSDGLVADLGHILTASGVGAKIDLGLLPTLAELIPELAPEHAWDLALSGGDDYELCFTVAADREHALVDIATECKVCVTRIGEIVADTALRLQCPDGSRFEPTATGYRHF
jgi:thiamine-monophosphate kinase